MPTESPIRFSTVGPVSPEDTADASIREFFTVKQVAQRWGVSPDFVRRVFAEEPGVLLFSNQLTRGKKRRYSTMRIPREVLLRVERKYSIVTSQNIHTKQQLAVRP